MPTRSPGRGDVLETPAPALRLQEAEQIVRLHFGLTGRLRPLVSERDQNFVLETGDGGRYVLKIANASEDPAVLDFQTQALLHIAARDPELPVPRLCPMPAGGVTALVEHDHRTHAVRLLSFLAGTPLGEVAPEPALRRNLGRTVARLGRALRGFFHPAARHGLLWDMGEAARLRAYLPLVEDGARRRGAAAAFERFESSIAPRLADLRAQVIHNDCNPDNVLVDDSAEVTGIVDFGDMVHGALACDLAVAAAYQLLEQVEPIAAACDVIGAYHAVVPLEPEELELLPDLMATRLAMSAVICTWRGREHPGNRDYILGHNDLVWNALARLAETDPAQAAAAFRAACGASPGTIPAVQPPALAARRSRRLGSALRLFYDEPLHIIRGEGAWLYDATGRAYLDAYNNVAHVGHCHPAVTAALARQAQALNTNTRYLHEHIVEYAERLAALLPGELGIAMFVCTGSEANDLALQIARCCTGHRGAIVTEHAYHGNTTAVMQLSPEEQLAEQRADWVEFVPAPDTYRGDPAGWSAAVHRAIDALALRGLAPAALFIDTLFASDGIFVPPPRPVQEAFAEVRAAGALCIADEVQAGFGRTGRRWGFEHYGVVPDIVTLGKPMGNGHPLAAVITTPAIAAVFGRERSYFNTFGGNPVSCAVGLAVLDVLEREQLQRRAREVGEYLQAGLQAFIAEHPSIGDVRGAGLFWGLELVEDRGSRAPASAAARQLTNELRRRGVLVGRTGRHDNVLKIRPPMVFGRSHADQLLRVLKEALARLPAP